MAVRIIAVGGQGAMLRFRGGIMLVLLVAAAPLRAAEPTGVAVEFFNAALGHYLVTTAPAELAASDSAGWVRTGGQFGAWTHANDAPRLIPVCLFYEPASGPRLNRP